MVDEYTIDEGYKWGSIWVKMDPFTGDYTAVPMLSENGSALNFSVHGAADGEYVYRTGILRGHNLQISPDETIWNTQPEGDSLYYTFLVKETAQGDNIWHMPLSGFQNIQSSDLSQSINLQYQVSPIQEVNDDLYLGLYYRVDLYNNDDSLYFNDFMGDESIYSKPEWFEPDPSTPTYVAKSARELIRINSAGEKVAKLIMPLRHPDPWDVSHAGWFFQEPKLFKVNDKLGWPHTYTSGSDTTIYVLKINADASTDSIGIDFPAGRGVYVLWLDENLDLVDHILYAFSTPSNFTAGVSITNIRALNQDTLLVDGKITNNTTTSLDPVGLADEVTYSPATSFVALYSIPDFLVSQNSPLAETRSLLLFPNPTNDNLTISSNFDSQVNYAIFDMAGREISNGNIAARENLTTIDVKALEKGIYLMIIEDAGIRLASEKFVVN